MIQHYAPLLTSIKTMFGYKTTSLFGVSIFSAISLEVIIKTILQGQFMGVSILLLLIVSGFILIDWWYGTRASKKLMEDAIKIGDKEAEEKYKFRSLKISHTWFKFLSVWLWLVIALAISSYSSSITWLSALVEGFTIIPLLLFGFREFVSIGESIEVLNNGNKPYLFELGEKIFDILQFKFLKRLGGDSPTTK